MLRGEDRGEGKARVRKSGAVDIAPATIKLSALSVKWSFLKASDLLQGMF